MVARTWIGGGTNSATDPANWSPAGAPVPGDSLTMSNGTMNIDLTDLDPPGQFLVNGTAAINMVAATVCPINTGNNGNNLTINMRGPVSTSINQGGGSVTLDLAGAWSGTINQSALPGSGTLTVNGGVLVHSGNSVIGPDGSSARINSVVLGTGSFTITNFHGGTGILEFSKAVGPGQTVTVSNGFDGQAVLIINDPSAFFGTVLLQGNPADKTEVSVIHLNNLVGADSYSFAGDILSLWDAGRVIDTLSLTSATAFSIVKPNPTSVAIYVGAGTPPAGTPLPVHPQ
ncbi:hypothetical protein [Rhodopila sp.]|uniref:hypothetical protein n=1 Tax=Rhodopila sp. TaxID=2480087 RepID=UPI003D0CF3B2